MSYPPGMLTAAGLGVGGWNPHLNLLDLYKPSPEA